MEKKIKDTLQDMINKYPLNILNCRRKIYSLDLKEMSSQALEESQLYIIMKKNGNTKITNEIIEELNQYSMKIILNNEKILKINEEEKNFKIPESIGIITPNSSGLTKGSIAYIGNFLNRGFNPYSIESLEKHIRKIMYKNKILK